MSKVVEICAFDFPQLGANIMPGVTPSVAVSSASGGTYGTRVLRIIPNKTVAVFRAGRDITYTPGSIALALFQPWLHGTNDPTAANPVNQLLAVVNANQSPYFYIRVDETKVLELYDSNSALLGTANYTKGTYSRVAILWEPGNASGDWAWYPDFQGDAMTRRNGTAAFGGTDAQADFTPGLTTMAMWLGGQGGNQPVPTGDCDVRHDDCYLMDDVTDINDAVGISAGKTGDYQAVFVPANDYRIQKASQVPDCDKDGTPGGDNTTTGNWENVGNNDQETTEVTYDTAVLPAPPKSGAVKVAALSSRQLDYADALLWVWYYKSAEIRAVYGIYDGSTYNVDVDVMRSSAAAYRYDRRVWDLVDVINAQQRMHEWVMVGGFEGKPGGKAARTHRLAEMFMASLEAIPLVTGKPTIGKTGNVTRGKRRWH